MLKRKRKRSKKIGKFFGRLKRIEDQGKLVQECGLLGPLLGGDQNQAGDRQRSTLPKILRQIANGDIYSYLQDQATEVEKLETLVKKQSDQLRSELQESKHILEDFMEQGQHSQLNGQFQTINQTQGGQSEQGKSYMTQHVVVLNGEASSFYDRDINLKQKNPFLLLQSRAQEAQTKSSTKDHSQHFDQFSRQQDTPANSSCQAIERQRTPGFSYSMFNSNSWTFNNEFQSYHGSLTESALSFAVPDWQRSIRKQQQQLTLLQDNYVRNQLQTDCLPGNQTIAQNHTMANFRSEQSKPGPRHGINSQESYDPFIQDRVGYIYSQERYWTPSLYGYQPQCTLQAVGNPNQCQSEPLYASQNVQQILGIENQCISRDLLLVNQQPAYYQERTLVATSQEAHGQVSQSPAVTWSQAVLGYKQLSEPNLYHNK